MLGQYGSIVLMDSTHNTCFSVGGKDEKIFLTSLIVKNNIIGKGVPVAWCLTSGESQ
jgi:hypothetical protein